MRLLVCGGRDFDDEQLMDTVLSCFTDSLTIIHGGARGADTLAGRWAEAAGVLVRVFHADWETYDVSAGPIRNQQMLDKGQPDIVLAFPGGRGTEDMVNRAKRAGVPVLRVLR